MLWVCSSQVNLGCLMFTPRRRGSPSPSSFQDSPTPSSSPESLFPVPVPPTSKNQFFLRVYLLLAICIYLGLTLGQSRERIRKIYFFKSVSPHTYCLHSIGYLTTAVGFFSWDLIAYIFALLPPPTHLPLDIGRRETKALYT